MNVLEEEVRWIGVAAKNRPLAIRGTPSPACAVLGPNDFRHHYKTDFAQNESKIGCQRKCEEAVIRMLVYIGRHQATLAARLENAEALVENRPNLPKKVPVAGYSAQISPRLAIVGLIPVWRAGDYQGNGVILDEGKISAVPVDNLQGVRHQRSAIA